MLFSKKKGLSIDTLIGEDTAIDGDLVFAGGLRLDGRVRGNVTAAPGKPSMLVVSEKGMVEGEISVGHLVLNGTVKGPVQATDLLELQPHARVLGDVRYAALEMHQGALVEGRLMPLVQGEIKALPNLLEAAPAAEVTEAADEAAATDRAVPAGDAHPTEKAA
ncbi:integral membrane protein involved in cell shape determination [Cupriavidus necator N-1]|jgi:cytoskeletal protein CcmA (bactofilin family)|uniref:Integral membrane protein involved in cell shape determination n=1 Tax=Cupriavidus necator (strain ATCC 43291 / DSM 13513 / CCUG 52238 / LMG 8453 / N-1) TaxID=1042878 RepID=G0EVG7_CUPNN|nr:MULTISPECIES: polymer-forming cytoskeletal protein [Cupriavidus]AEI75871.1 integral membrane protein involved in cell shape determination [Cupriavidus necator N-1]KAI3599895.1 Integral membrane protein CcmA involved in cell shape determination [Cupriavidus necator H850]MDX6011990.1 polymer-forming cytoskeletal protein [Cupriavidus necator]QUN28914.1 polymer-forming cytoskeletal protein [Cupriavidus sp. KK10]